MSNRLRTTYDPKGDKGKKAQGNGLSDITVWQRPIYNLYNEQAEAIAALNVETKRDTDAFLIDIQNSHHEMSLAMREDWRETSDATTVFAEQAARNMQSHFAEFFYSFDGGLKGMVAGFADTLRRMVAELAAQQMLTSFFTWGAGLGGGVGSFFGDMLEGITGKAIGGPVSGGKPYLVGERGRELFVPSSSGRIVPNGALGSGGGNVTVSYSIDARGADAARIMAVLPPLLRQTEDHTIARVRELIGRGKL